MRRVLLLPCVALLLHSPPASAQAGGSGAAVTGEVRSEAGAALPSASVVLRRMADSTVVNHLLTTPDGRFRIPAVADGRYRVEVTLLGYQPWRSEALSLSGAALDLGVIRMTQAVVTLEGLQAVGDRPPLAIQPDRTVYATRDMPVASSGTASDVLRSVPELEVDVEGKIRTRGAEPKIHINGRPAPLTGDALTRYLEQMPADRIERVEVIPNPSARYEAEGQGGIVNIVLKEGIDLGVSGNLSMNGNSKGRNGFSGRLNYQAGRLTVFGGANLNLMDQEFVGSSTRQNLLAEPVTSLHQASRNSNSGYFGGVDLTTELKVGPRGTFWGEVRGNGQDGDARAHNAYTHLDASQRTTERYDRRNEMSFDGLWASSVLGYRHVLQPQRNEWSVEVRDSRNDMDTGDVSDKYPFTLAGEPLDVVSERSRSSGTDGLTDRSLQTDLLRPWGKEGRIELGYRGALRSTDNSRSLEFVPGAGTGGAGTSQRSQLDYRERFQSGYVTLNRKLGRFAVQVGVRAEHTDTHLELPLGGETIDTSYLSLFPNANVALDLGGGRELRLSHSRRLQRPGPWMLNPLNLSTDPLNRFQGNPYLGPSYTLSWTLDASWMGERGTLRLSPYYRSTEDGWNQIWTVDGAGVSTMTWQNLASTESYGVTTNLSLRPIGPFSGFLNANGFREVRDASNLSSEFSGSSMRWSFGGNLSVRASGTLSAQISGTYNPARDLPQGTQSGMLFSTIALRKQLWGTRGSLSLSVTDPFDIAKSTFRIRDQTMVSTSDMRPSLRAASLSFTYSFGRPPQSSRRQNQPEEMAAPAAVGPVP